MANRRRTATNRDAIIARRAKVVPRAWLSGKQPVLRFVLTFAVLSAVFNIFFFAKFAQTEMFRSYLQASAGVAAALLRTFATEAVAADGGIGGSGFQMRVAVGCDALQPVALFCCAVLATPIGVRRKMAGLIAGVAALLALNILRIVTLFLIGVHVPRFFEVFHVDIWQAAFIALALVSWVSWAVWAGKPQMGVNRATS